MAAVSDYVLDDKLQHNLAIDATSATIAAGLVTPAVTIMDRIVVERSCTGRPLLASFKTHVTDAFKQSRRFMPAQSTRLVFTLYVGTFVAANVTSTLSTSRYLKLEPTGALTATTLATLSVNVPLGIYKDTVFSRLFGCVPLPATPSSTPILPRTPRSTFFAFLFRDAITIYTSFALPGIVSLYVPDFVVSDPQSKTIVSQIVVPALGQVMNTPAHLVGLELYNRQGHAKLSNIPSAIRKDFVIASVTRMCRIIPAFGFGTLTNNEIRESLRYNLTNSSSLDHKDSRQL